MNMPRKRKNSDARQPVYLLIALICILVPAVIIGMLISLPGTPLRQPNSWELTATQVFSEQTAVAEGIISVTPLPSPTVDMSMYLTATHIVAGITSTADAAMRQTAVCAPTATQTSSGTSVAQVFVPDSEDDDSWALSPAEIAAETAQAKYRMMADRCPTATAHPRDAARATDFWALTATQIVSEITATHETMLTQTTATPIPEAQAWTATAIVENITRQAYTNMRATQQAEAAGTEAVISRVTETANAIIMLTPECGIFVTRNCRTPVSTAIPIPDDVDVWALTATQIVAEMTQTAESEQTATQAAR